METSTAACQARCANQAGCAFFSFFTGDGGCHLTAAGATTYATPSDWNTITISGESTCIIPASPPPPVQSPLAPPGTSFSCVVGWYRAQVRPPITLLQY